MWQYTHTIQNSSTFSFSVWRTRVTVDRGCRPVLQKIQEKVVKRASNIHHCIFSIFLFHSVLHIRKSHFINKHAIVNILFCKILLIADIFGRFESMLYEF